MINRRKFLLSAVGATLGLGLPKAGKSKVRYNLKQVEGPVIISTWEHGLPANQEAWKVLVEGHNILDAVESGVMVPEADPNVDSVGYGGSPDSSGEVTLDACIMNSKGDAGAVACLKDILHPVAVARLVMEKTDHVMLTGNGALQFALNQGFSRTNLLTPAAKETWEKWKKEGSTMQHTSAGHDTIGMVARDASGDFAGACTTSGLKYKMPGRVGDSPIIGAGLYLDNEVGGASATGQGELVMKTLGSFLIVELMRNGYTPEEACREALLRIRKKISLKPEYQVGFIALSKTGETGAYSLRKGFSYAVMRKGNNQLMNASSL